MLISVQLSQKIEDMKVLETPEIDRARPFVEESVYALASSYVTIRGRFLFLLLRDVENGHVLPWFEDVNIEGY